MIIRLLELMDGNTHPFGNIIGRKTLQRLQQTIDLYPSDSIFEISLEGIEATDSSFPRESVVSLAKQFRGEKWFYLTHFSSVDLIDNWDYAAKAKLQPILIVQPTEARFIGPELKGATKDLLDFVVNRKIVSTSNLAKELNITVQNASTRLKRLVSEGYLIRSEEASLTGGIEYLYAAPQKSD
ncbi:MarR family transcriptional regulator [Acinetobacter baumannii]|uniref:MarR family transcriptional regulator n=1 Tax=Acinetobacter baumannii TaxID=470 RepID=A0A245ZZ88_ACIBA|nr:helix-turn-helix domain-containing protein [Acinetobacter baumannii]EKX9481398.1 MarR family transcriptional regulator [Acinetobacter baumannii]MBP4063872.1 MarR family transcriptional regulator [Acinetobacter baumannii]MCA4426023.1 MarR family transcriptional regulator [Acinetobacter baumannii]MCG6617526.1 winged helix-turn-helix transcriptional regulator [Acinetobacter baumannii]MCT9459584.1 MarR family transcriptional regulator [Acinetobacter baumannii]